MKRLLLWWRERRRPPVDLPHQHVTTALYKIRGACPAIPFHAVVNCDRLVVGTRVWNKLVPVLHGSLDDVELAIALKVVRFDVKMAPDGIIATRGLNVVWSGYDA